MYSIESQKKIFLGFLDMIKNKEEQELLRQTSLNLILPILSTIFKEKKDVLLLNSETFDIIKEKIKHIQATKPPAYVYMEMTLLLDYIVSRMNLTRNDEKVYDFLNVDVLHFSWKNISHPRENLKQLKNLSKLLVSRLFSRFNILQDKPVLPDKPAYVQQLYTTVVQDIEDVTDDESKHIWIRTCEILLPKIKQYNQVQTLQAQRNIFSETNTVTGSVSNAEQQNNLMPPPAPTHSTQVNRQAAENANQANNSKWLEQFLKGMDFVHNSQASIQKDLPHLFNRYWQVIIQNREIIKEKKSMVMEANKFYSVLNQYIHLEKMPYILLDILLLYLSWYIDEYKIKYKDTPPWEYNSVHQGLGSSEAPSRILSVNAQKETFILQMLMELMKRDEDNAAFFLNRCFYLLRKFLIVFKEGKLNMDQVVELINRRRNQNNFSHTHSSNKEEQLSTYKRFRLNFITMNVALCLLYQYEGREGEQKLKEKSYAFIMNELPHKDSTNFHKFPYLIPLAYQLMKKILVK